MLSEVDSTNPLKILVVEDDCDVRLIINLSLSRVASMDVQEAMSGQSALEMVEKNKFDVVLLDVMMPDMDGPTTLRALRLIPGGENLPVIFLTAKALPNEINRLKNTSALDVITKPFDPMKLGSQIQQILDLRHE